MKRLYLTVEGQTEAAFANDVLMPHLTAFGVFLYPSRFTGLHGRRRGRIPRGGLLGTFQHAVSDMRRWLKEDRSADARFSMMIDLYGLPRDFPGYDEGTTRPTGWEQAVTLEQSLASAIGDTRFIPYLQVHEFEALVLADPRQIESIYEGHATGVAELCDDCSAFGSPEQINHGHYSHPKYRIKQKVPRYDENVAGPLLTGNIGLPSLREKCPLRRMADHARTTRRVRVPSWQLANVSGLTPAHRLASGGDSMPFINSARCCLSIVMCMRRW